MPLLHVTNGSSIVPAMREAGIAGRIVPWDDVLHEGPVPAGLNAGALRDTRAEFLASCGWGTSASIVRQLSERDQALEALERVDEIVLWFEHDLYDQLQLVQILDRLPVDGVPRITAVAGDDYLGYQPVTRFGELFGTRREVTSSQRLAARDAWTAFRSADPRAIVDAIPRVSDLPHLPAALRRHLQQYPSTTNGLSRTEQQALEAIARGITALRDVYAQANHQSEEAVFMSDAAFLAHIRALTQPPAPLLTISGDQLSLTVEGRQVLAGEEDRVGLCGIDRWLGGVHLHGRGRVWRWNAQRDALRFA